MPRPGGYRSFPFHCYSHPSGNQAVAETTWDGTLQGDFAGPGGTISANGKRMQELRVAFVYTAEGAKLKEVNVYFDIAALIQQISP